MVISPASSDCATQTRSSTRPCLDHQVDPRAASEQPPAEDQRLRPVHQPA